MLASISDFVGRVQPGSWPDWLAAIGTTLAFGVAAVAYSRDVRTRRWAQARLVHIEVTSSNTTFLGRDAPVYGDPNAATVGDVVWIGKRSVGRLMARLPIAPAAVVVAKIYNGSDELLGLTLVRAYGRNGPGDPWDFEVKGGPVGPRSEVVIDLLCSLTLSNPKPDVELEVTFRDSAGRWWRRRGVEPVRRAKDKEREIRRAGRAITRQRLRARWGSAFPASVRKAGLHLRARWDAGANSG
ncbi:hypothetical protein [Oerskovia enterophila]|uniref:hypothetical protein n=1 Tax=Oerskovia enterophila TaxID=43678 RepID=UPI0011118E61|nr:hypothetical protein [Oerskovia enterophila]